MDRLILSLVISVIFGFFAVTVFNNIVDYSNTFAFIQHTFSMDTTKQNPHFMWRAIGHPLIQHFAFVSIIALQTCIAILCAWGIIRLNTLRQTRGIYRALKPAMLGLTLAFVLYGLGFIVIAGQWFMMRESTTWNVQASVHVFLTLIAAVLIFVKLFDDRMR